MDLKRLHKAATDALTGNGVNTEMAYAMQMLQLLTNPDPLTLDAAVKVMGREPDRKINAVTRTICEWYAPYVQVRVWNSGDIGVLFREDVHDNPTVGQFACLVAAARMGEKA